MKIIKIGTVFVAAITVYSLNSYAYGAIKKSDATENVTPNNIKTLHDLARYIPKFERYAEAIYTGRATQKIEDSFTNAIDALVQAKKNREWTVRFEAGQLITVAEDLKKLTKLITDNEQVEKNKHEYERIKENIDKICRYTWQLISIDRL